MPPAPTRDAFPARFQARAEGRGELPLADFIALSLYDPVVGYYRTRRKRVGREAGTDFYTAANLDLVFGPLVAGAARTLLGNASAAEHTFVELGAEPDQSVLAGVEHGFMATSAVRLGDGMTIPDRAVVFSNELFDAQPFHRVVGRGGSWREVGVRIRDDRFETTELATFSPEVTAVRDRLPYVADEGYVLDLPLHAEALLRTMCSGGWRGLFIACDYGRTWAQLTTEFPHGTGRAYSAHRQSGDLLAQPGAQDLTCHVCWDWLEAGLRAAGFLDVTRESTEGFFVRHAADTMEQLLARDANPLARVRTQLKHLMHPALFGQRFEVLWARRP